jgi:glycosyltransferase involved in cell wall biosynthesis
MIYYLPLEPLPERYTVQLSAPKKGWLERRWIQHNIDYQRVEGERLTEHIKTGSVLDANGRGYWALSQVKEVLRLIDAGQITSHDILYFDDFWHPGISALQYSFDLMKIHPKLFCMLHAQTVDPYDFTYSMRHWMRHFEIGMGKIFTGIFVTSTCLRDALLYAGIGTEESVHLAGLPFNSEEVREHWPKELPKKKKQVVFSSRWDKEKRPDVFLKIVEDTLQIRDDITFVVSSSFPKLKSNSSYMLSLLQYYLRTYPNNLFLREGQTKEQYYHNLLESKVQINTADQDFVSWTMLEATTCGCQPLYPYFLSFPEALGYDHRYMYQKNDVDDAVSKIVKMVDKEPTTHDFVWVYAKYDRAWKRMYDIMTKGETDDPLYCD